MGRDALAFFRGQFPVQIGAQRPFVITGHYRTLLKFSARVRSAASVA